MTDPAIDTGDVVFHRPSQDVWLVAYAKGDRLAWVGWLEGEALLDDCVLSQKATQAVRLQLLVGLAAGTDAGDARVSYACRRLFEMNGGL